MADGDVLQIVAGHQAFAAPTGGGVQTVTLLGPFAIAYDDAGIATANPPILLAALAAGTVIVRAWMEDTAAWVSDAGNVRVIICIAADSDPTTFEDIVSYGAAANASQADFGIEGVSVAVPSPLPFRSASAILACHLGVYAYATGGNNLIAGAGNIYALIATPA